MRALFAMGRGPGGPPHLTLLGIPVRIELSFILMAVILGSDGPPSQLVLWLAVLFPFMATSLQDFMHMLAGRVAAIGTR